MVKIVITRSDSRRNVKTGNNAVIKTALYPVEVLIPTQQKKIPTVFPVFVQPLTRFLVTTPLKESRV